MGAKPASSRTRLAEVSRHLSATIAVHAGTRRLQHLKHMETMMRSQKIKGIYDMPYTMHFG